MEKPRITNHALKRLKRRTGINKKSLQDLVDEAYKFGLRRKETTGSLRKYADYLFYKKEGRQAIRFYKNFVFIFEDGFLLTVYALEGRHQKNVQNQLESRK